MQKLTLKQTMWLKSLFLEYFPLVLSHSDPLFNSYPIDLFKDHLNFAKEGQALILPKHLQFFDERESGNPSMELDLPELLGKKPFRNLIDKNYLDELKNEVMLKKFDIFDYIIRKEEELFSFHFLQKYNSSYIFSESVPVLFVKALNDKNIFAEYDDYAECFIWDFSQILFHHPDNLSEAYQRFAHKVYNLRAFAIEGNIPANDYTHETLEKLFFDYLKRNIENPKKLSDELKHYRESDWENPDKKSPLLRMDTYYEMVNLVLSGKIKNIDIHIPTDLSDLLGEIDKQSNNKFLDSHSDDPFFPNGDKNTIRNIYKKIVGHSDSEFLSQKSKIELINANAPKGKGNVYIKINALYELINNPENKYFLSLPDISKIITSKYIVKIDELKNRISIKSINKPIYNIDGKEISIEDLLDDSNSISGKKTVRYGEDEIIYKDDLTVIRTCIEKQFPEEHDSKFVDELTKFLGSKLTNLSPQAKKNVLENEWKQYALGKVFDYYTSLNGMKDFAILGSIKKLFNLKMQNILHSYREMAKEYDNFEMKV